MAALPNRHPALTLLNSLFSVDVAKALAAGVSRKTTDPETRIGRLHELNYFRPPDQEETALGLHFPRESPVLTGSRTTASPC